MGKGSRLWLNALLQTMGFRGIDPILSKFAVFHDIQNAV